MKKSRYSNEQIAYAIKTAASETTISEICRKMGISEATFYIWKRKFDGLDR